MHRKADEEAIPVGMDDEDPGSLRNRAAIRGVATTPRGAIWARQTLGELSVVTTSVLRRELGE